MKGKPRRSIDDNPSKPLKHPPRSEVGDMTPKQKLLKQILALRDSIEAEKGVLSESYPLIREDRER